MSDNKPQSGKGNGPVRSAKLQKYSAPALEKGLEILEYLSMQQDGKSMLQIAAGVARSKNEIFRMMIVLEESGYVERQDADSFVLSDKLYQLGLRRPGNKRLTDVALPLMEAFAEALPFCCYLSVASGEQSVVIAKADSAVPLGLSVTIGHRLPLVQSAEGLCLMAFMSDPRREMVIERLGLNDTAITSLHDLLRACRASGEMVRASDMIPGVEHVALPILDSIGDSAVATIAVPFIALKQGGASLEEVKGELRLLSERINANLSHKSTPKAGLQR